MASDTKKKAPADSEAEETKAPAPTESSRKSSGPGIMLPLVIVAILLGLGGLGVGGYFLFTHMQEVNAATEGSTTGDAGTASEVTNTNIYFDEFPEGIVNLQISDKNPFTYLKYQFSLEVDNEKTKEVLKTMLPKLKGKVATVMSNRSWDDISLSKGRDDLSREVLAAVNESLTEGRCIGLYFTTFVAQ